MPRATVRRAGPKLRPHVPHVLQPAVPRASQHEPDEEQEARNLARENLAPRAAIVSPEHPSARTEQGQ
eukprot:788090-Rhodomonas_salina.2